MTKKTKITLICLISILVISNFFLLLLLSKTTSSAPLASKNFSTNEGLNLSAKQKNSLRLICSQIKESNKQSDFHIDVLHTAILSEIGKDKPDSLKVDSLYNEILSEQKNILSRISNEYKKVASNLDQSQIEKLNPIYFDLFLRIHTPPSEFK